MNITILRYPRQQTSDLINLQKGKLYYMEADMLEETGDDHLEIGVQLPSGQKYMPIPVNMLRTSKFASCKVYLVAYGLLKQCSDIL